jgi:transposase
MSSKRERGYDVKVAHPLLVKAIAYARVKTDKVDARMLADLLRADMIPEAYVPGKDVREVRDLVRRRDTTWSSFEPCSRTRSTQSWPLDG